LVAKEGIRGRAARTAKNRYGSKHKEKDFEIAQAFVLETSPALGNREGGTYKPKGTGSVVKKIFCFSTGVGTKTKKEKRND